ncbi:MAG: hypothetical protein OQK82_02895 [Candidatus Pacearchaeota archaeon]|nr:hypothetical protein [Candidatus Pacearchaeota archaeon]
MKNEIYSCLKMLQALYNRTTNAHNIGRWEAAKYLNGEYIRIRNLLKKYLPIEQFEFIPSMQEADFSKYGGFYLENAQKGCISSVATACDVAISFLRSLEMSLDRELIKQKAEFNLKEKELELKEKEVEHMNNLLSKSLKAIEKFPELQRSKVMEDIKKSHREIEKNTNPYTKSQNN